MTARRAPCASHFLPGREDGSAMSRESSRMMIGRQDNQDLPFVRNDLVIGAGRMSGRRAPGPGREADPMRSPLPAGRLHEVPSRTVPGISRSPRGQGLRPRSRTRHDPYRSSPCSARTPSVRLSAGALAPAAPPRLSPRIRRAPGTFWPANTFRGRSDPCTIRAMVPSWGAIIGVPRV